MDIRCFKTKRTHCNILQLLVGLRSKEPFRGVQPYDRIKEAAKDSLAQKWSVLYINAILVQSP